MTINYLYLRFTLHVLAVPFTFLQNIFIDADNNVSTGYRGEAATKVVARASRP